MSDFKARPTVYKGVKMRSRLEAGFAAWLDAEGLAWHYEPFAVASEEGQYLPDFMVTNLVYVTRMAVRPVFFEVKPKSFDLRSEDGARTARSMALVVQSVPDAVLVVAQPSGLTELVPGCSPDCGGHLNALEPFEALACREPTFGSSLSWVVSYFGNCQTGLARVLPAESEPWADEYWKVG